MLTSIALAGLLTAPLLANAAVVPNRPRTFPNGMKLYTPRAFAERSADVVTSNYAQLTRQNAGASHSNAIAVMRSINADVPSASLNNADGVEYLVSMKWADQEFQAILDTGSSDTWLISADFTCTDAQGQTQSASQCGFGPGYSGQISTISGEQFNISYGDGEFVTGEMGTVDVSIGGLTVPNQEVALGTSAYWQGGGVASGLVGMAYPSITSAFDSSGQRTPYDPFFTSAYKENLTAPTFALALMRGSSGGYISFGGLPPVQGINGTFAQTSIEVLSGSSDFGNELSFYTITPDAIAYPGASKSNSAQYIVDSGTTLNYMPSKVAKAINAAYSPKATLDSQNQVYTVDCSATPPQFGVTIGGTTLYADAQDMILGVNDPSNQINGKCITAIQDSGSSGVSILGDAWLKSVVAVFDVGASEMRFAAHSY
ncbi:uncharacterized protein PV09_04389 [Verruconis gallopava]|uniref:Peptidase A1 domain-containing protein n=1 Tax=Verruconis gallopava TaxID=253628 RepID=A0A0D2AZW1_9PEZI|nr:uncharacterized protein PV09_04389 [Verruconis gallopava]KIW04644.1 hypothetical protein PV09_04389 [Verruconis gallopava]